MEDFLYGIKFKSLDDEKSPLLKDILKSLEDSLASVIIDLQKMYYNDTAEEFIKHIYITFESSDFTKSGISTGNYLLFEPHRNYEKHAKLIVSHALNILRNMLVSYQSLKLDEKFCVRITVLRCVINTYFLFYVYCDIILFNFDFQHFTFEI